MKPLIGVIPAMESDEKFYKVSKNNLVALEEAGGIPVVLSYLSNANDIDQIIEQLDGLYLTGGDDIDPIHFNEEPHPNLGAFNPKRDAFEIEVTKKMLVKDKPVLGVCKGAQIINLASGGDMYQDIHAQIDDSLLQHNQKAPNYVALHEVELMKGSLIYQVVGRGKIRVNSFHHQANRQVDDAFVISGRAKDGVVEVVESKVHRFVLGVQWHPEMMAAVGDDFSNKIFEGFISACKH